MSAIISAQELHNNLGSSAKITVLDVRYRLDAPDGRDAFAAGHIPSAVYVDMDSELAGHGEPHEGRHPVPSAQQLQRAVRRWGVQRDDAIVIVDDWNMLGSARAWWLLKGAGFSNVRVLDGAMNAWRAMGGALEEGASRVPEPSDTVIDHVPAGITTAEAAQFDGTLIDVRAADRYRGESEPFDPIAGHIPGAVNVPSSEFFSEGLLRPAGELRGLLETAAGDKPIAMYCGSGITAAQAALVADIAGVATDVYVGSWSAWSNTQGAAVAVGAEPGTREHS